MDPNATLKRIREFIESVTDGETPDPHEWYDFIDLVEGLDDWMSRGAFMPEDWSKSR